VIRGETSQLNPTLKWVRDGSVLRSDTTQISLRLELNEKIRRILVVIEWPFDGCAKIIPIMHQHGAKTNDRGPIADIVVSLQTRLKTLANSGIEFTMEQMISPKHSFQSVRLCTPI
jgi:hypothetical protein